MALMAALQALFYVFYQTGIVGLKLGPRDPFLWSFEGIPGGTSGPLLVKR